MESTPGSFELTAKQVEANRLAGSAATHVMAYGGSRSGKTFNWVRAIAVRAIAAPGSRHLIARLRFNAVKVAIVHDTFPKVMRLCFPDVPWKLDKQDWFAHLPGDSQVWFGGLDDKERAEKILGQEYATILLNECSQIPYASRNIALTRLAQRARYRLKDGSEHYLRRKMLYDENPPSAGYWTHKLFIRKFDPETNRPLDNQDDFAVMQINPRDNLVNLDPAYIKTLEALPARMRKRFLDGVYGEAAAGALWTIEAIERWRDSALELPDMQRVIVAVDPSGSGDDENDGADEIGIMVVGLGLDGFGYVLEDLTCKAGPAVWGNVAAQAFDRHQADLVVAEKNFGGEMVRFVLRTARAGLPVKVVTASRGKAVRAEPISALTEQGKIRFAGNFPRLEDELCAMTTNGYMGARSPNRADAFVWGMSELFPGIVRPKDDPEPDKEQFLMQLPSEHAWMGV